ncbi:MAG: hypothetical protein V3V10_01385 [Planctomycetota bacterium]
MADKKAAKKKSGKHMPWPLRIPLELFLRITAFWMTLFGPAWAYWWARRLATFAWVVLPHRKIAIRNVNLCFPEKSAAEHKRIARASFRHFCYSFVDYLLIPKYLMKDKSGKYLKPLPDDSFVAKASRDERPVVLMSAHFGNWEITGHEFSRFGSKISCVVRDIRPPLVDRWINGAREAMGSKVIRKKDAARGMARVLKDKTMLAILIDQNGGDHAPVETFFGVPVTWQWDVSRFIVKHDCIVCYTYGLRIDEKFKFEVPDYPLREYKKGADPMQVVRDYRDWLENAIGETPEQYFWMHKRFKAWKEGWPRRYENLGQSLTPEQYQKMLVVPGFEPDKLSA